MSSYARWLFGMAAAFNFAVAAGLLFMRPLLAPLVKLDPVTGTNLINANTTGVMIATFSYAYLRVAANPTRFRNYIHLGIIGKLLVVVGSFWPWLTGAVDWHLPALATVDVIFTL